MQVKSLERDEKHYYKCKLRRKKMNLHDYIEEVYNILIPTSDLNESSYDIIKSISFEKLIFSINSLI